VSSRATWLVVASLFVASAACSGVLGLDAPTLSPCADGVSCVDASTPDAPSSASDGGVDAGTGTDANDATDASPDQGPLTGIRCGGGSFALTGCPGSTAVCCQVTGDSGATTYTCRNSAADCEGFPIGCTHDDDCPGNDVCCQQSTSIKCVGQSSCANASLLCEPDAEADQCPTGWSCAGPVTIDGVSAPYSACTQ
jgi:hypothetical protein